MKPQNTSQKPEISDEALDYLFAGSEPVSIEDYAAAVNQLLTLAQGDTSGSRAAAQVLLSAGNSCNWQLAVTDLCSLDSSNLRLALQVIEGRAELMKEPQNVIENGHGKFDALCAQWVETLSLEARSAQHQH